MDLTTFKDMLSNVYGLDESGVPDGMSIDAIISQAIKKISTYYPKLIINSLQCVVGQTRYSVTDENLIRVKEVFYNGDIVSYTFNGEIPNNANGLPLNGTFSPSMATASIYEKETMRRLYPYGADIVSHNEFDLIPTPTSVSTIYYEYERHRVISEIPDIFEEDMVELVFFYLEEGTYKRSKIETGGNTYGFDRRGNISDNTAGSVESKYKVRMETLKAVETSIKTKVMRLA